MIVTTVNSIEGFEIVEYLDILTAEDSIDTTIAKAFQPWEKTANYISKTHQGQFSYLSKKVVLEGLKYQAQSIGADGVIGVSFHFIPVKNSYVEIFGTGTAVKIKKKSNMTVSNESENTKTVSYANQDNSVQQPLVQNDEKVPTEYSGDSIQALRFIVENIEQFKNTQAIKSYYLKAVKPDDVDVSLVQILDKRIALERMYGSMKYDTKKDIEKILGTKGKL